jgi:hypothetical protein
MVDGRQGKVERVIAALDNLSLASMTILRSIWAVLSHAWVLTFAAAITLGVFYFLRPMWTIYGATTFSAILYTSAVSGRQIENVGKLAPYLLEALVSVTLATGLVAVLSRNHPPDFRAEHLVTGIALAIVLSGISILAKSAHNIKNAGDELDKALDVLQRAIKKTDETTDDLKQTIDLFGGEINKTNLVSLAARAVGVKEKTMNYEPIRNSIAAAMGTINTWAEGGMKSFAKIAEGGNNSGREAAERAWWRCLQSYHNEERYDLARFELVTNARNYTYVLASTLDQIRTVLALDSKGRTRGNRSVDVVIVQCSTFPPKDFYNFPDGTQGHRRYRDFEFYGTYRRSVSFLNRQDGMLPHRIVFVAHDKATRKDVDELERLGWRVDAQPAVTVGSARLFCAPYSVPVHSTRKGDPLPLFSDDAWYNASPIGLDEASVGGGVFYERHQICPILPFVGGGVGPRFEWWRDNVRDRFSRVLNNGKTYGSLGVDSPEQDRVNDLISLGPDSLRTPVNKDFLLEREKWAWEHIVERAFQDINESAGDEDRVHLGPQFLNLRRIREQMRKYLVDSSDADAGGRLSGLVQQLVFNSQYYDAICAELRAQINNSGEGWDKTWLNLRSMTKLAMGPGETWLYHALNCINGTLFEQLANGRKMLPIWDLFCWDFLGMDDAAIHNGESRQWGQGRTGVGSRIRFVQVKPGKLGDSEHVQEDGCLSALGFDDCLQREFTLVGTRKRPASDGDNPFEGTDWQLLVACEMAPPYSTCRLNFHFHDEKAPSASLLSKYSEWVELAWKNAESTTRDMFEDLNEEFAKTASAMPLAPA